MADLSPYISAMEHASGGAELRKPITEALTDINENGKDINYLIFYDVKPFSDTENYKKGTKVLHEDYIYSCTVNHDAGEWDDSHFTKYSSQKILPFSEDTRYRKGDRVFYKGQIYRCLENREPSKWKDSDFIRDLYKDAAGLAKKTDINLVLPFDSYPKSGSGHFLPSGVIYALFAGFENIDWSEDQWQT